MKYHISVKKAIIILGILAVVGLVAVFILIKQPNTAEYTVVAVERGKLEQTVSETGTVKAKNEINLSFPGGGKLAVVKAKVGDRVKKDDALAELDFSGLIFSKNEAQANLDVARSSLNKLAAGASAQEIAVARANVVQSQAAHVSAQNELAKTEKSANEVISQAQKNLSDLENTTDKDITTQESAVTAAQTKLANTISTYGKTIENSKTIALNAVEDKLSVANTALDVYYRTVNDEDGKDKISVKNLTYLTAAQLAYLDSLAQKGSAAVSLAAARISGTNDSVTKALNDTLTALDRVFATLENCYSALENSVISSDFTQAELDAFKAGISAQKTLVSAAITAIQAAKHNFDDAVLAHDTNVASARDALAQAQAAYEAALTAARNALASAQTGAERDLAAAQSRVSSAREALKVAEAQLSKVTAPADRYDIELAKAKVRQAEAAFNSVNKQIENAVIRAEISGTITKVNFSAGEQVAAGSPVLTMLADNDFEIELFISEADIAKLVTGDKTLITMDAFGDDIKFSGQVDFIDPAETAIQDVIYYKTKVGFDPGETEVKSGMTANATITTAEKDNALLIPSRAVIERNGQGRFVQVLVNNQPVEKAVTIGLRADDGLVEVLSGLEAGEQVITYTKEK